MLAEDFRVNVLRRVLKEGVKGRGEVESGDVEVWGMELVGLEGRVLGLFEGSEKSGDRVFTYRMGVLLNTPMHSD